MTVEEIIAKIQADPQVKAMHKNLRSGNASFSDTWKYQSRVSDLLGEMLSANMHMTPASLRKEMCQALLKESYENINSIMAQIQKEIDTRQGIHIAPQKAPYPAERVEKVADSLTDPTVKESVIERRAKSATATVSRSFHDDYVKTNAKFRSRAGLKCYITRKTDGTCCKWCSAMAGRYDYGSEPKDVYRRHDNCGCSVTYENGRKRQDVWSKRTWEAPEPGAGAGDPVVFTAEQAKALQKEKQLSYLTGGVKHGKLNAEEKIFLDRILADPDMEPKYRQILMDRFCSGSEIAQKAFNRFVPAESVANKSYSGIAHYVHNGNRIIWMNYSRDLKPGSSWLPGSTWFHEHGHLIDDYANRGTGLLSSHHPQFYDALKSDFVKLIQAQSQGAAIKNYEDALEYILNNTKLQLSFSSDLMKSKAQQESVSDIIEGLSDSYIRGCGGHNSSGIRPNSPKDDYWGEGKEREIIISAEAAAHMFEAQFDVGRYNQMKMYFPNALRIYEDMLKEVVS